MVELENSWAELQPLAEQNYAKQPSREEESEVDLPCLDEAIDEVFRFCRALEKCVVYKVIIPTESSEEQILARVFAMLENMQARNISIRNVLTVIAQCKQSLTTEVGLVRGFWRQVLNSGSCASVVVEIFASSDAVQACYKKESVWLNAELRQRMLRIAHKADMYRWNLVVDSFALNELPVYMRDVLEPPQQLMLGRRLRRNTSQRQQQAQSSRTATSPGLNFLARATKRLESLGALGGVPLFGSPLEKLLVNEARCHYAFLEPRLGAPKMIMQCIHRISHEIETEGLFQAPVHSEELAELRALLESEHGIPDNISTLAVAQILLDWLKALPEPLIPSDLFPPVISCWSIPERDARIRNLRLLMDRLPWAHRPVLARILHLFERACHNPSNGLTPATLAPIVSPLLLRGEYKKPNHTDADVAARAVELMQLMIESYEEVFSTIIAELDALNETLHNKCEKLLFVQSQVSEQLSANNEEHMQALQQLWDKLLMVAELRQGRVRSPSVATDDEEPGQRSRRSSSEGHQFALNSLVWKLCGMHRGQQEKGTELPSELKQVGILTVLSLTTFLTSYPEHSTDVILRFAVDRMQYCSAGQAAGLLTQMCAEILDLLPTPERPKVVPRVFARSPYWTLFDDPNAFEEIFSIAMLLFDKEWIAHTSARDVLANPETPTACLVAVRDALTKLVQEHVGKSTYEMKQVVLALLPEYQTHDSALVTMRRRGSSETSRTPDASPSSERPVATMPVSDPRMQDYFKDMPEAFTKVHFQIRTSVWGQVKILNRQIAEELEPMLPIEHQSKDWWLVYSMHKDGASLHTMLQRCKTMTPTLFLIRDTANCVFGGFSRTPWSMQRDRYYGTAGSMVFTFKNGMIQAYNGTNNNNYYCLTSEDSFAMGGGGNFAIYLDGDFLRGTSGQCATFESPCLASAEDFDCDAFEMYALLPGDARMVNA